MPHAALWVVQPHYFCLSEEDRACFNAAHGFVGDAARELSKLGLDYLKFQCRTRLCGWCNFL